MPTCKHCGETHETEALVRHEHDRDSVVVHCPSCHGAFGTYRQGSSVVDTRRDA